MVSAGRVCCIAAPFLLSIGCLVTLVLIFLAGTMDGNSTTGGWYFLKIDLRNFTIPDSADLDVGTSDSLASVLEAARQTLGMNDYYTIYLRNYCTWNHGEDNYNQCTDPGSYFWFNPINVWHLNGTGINIDDVLPDELDTGLDTYKAVSKAMFVLYCAALSASAFTIVVGISAIFSRWGSFFTTFFAAVMAVTTAAATICMTAMFVVVRNILNNTLEDDYDITSEIGNPVLAISWIGSAFAIAAGFFWLLSVCCCSGRSPYNPGSKEARRTRAEKTPYTYERVGSPYLGPRDGQNVPLNTLGGQGHGGYSYAPQPVTGGGATAYEPFRPH